jgi:hypothetical protein
MLKGIVLFSVPPLAINSLIGLSLFYRQFHIISIDDL